MKVAGCVAHSEIRILVYKPTWTPQGRKEYNALFLHMMLSLRVACQDFPDSFKSGNVRDLSKNLSLKDFWPSLKKYFIVCNLQLHELLTKTNLLPGNCNMANKHSLLPLCLLLGIWGWWRGEFKWIVLVNHHIWHFKTSSDWSCQISLQNAGINLHE